MNPINQSYYNSFFSFNSKYEYGDEFINLVKDDVLDNLTNKLDGYGYCFHVSLENDFISMCQVAIAYETIIKRAFVNSCNRMKYNLEDVLTEIDNLIFILRELAKNKEIEYSKFIGIRGLEFVSFSEIKLGYNTLYQYDNKFNPSMHTKNTINHFFDNNEEHFSGHILEIKTFVNKNNNNNNNLIVNEKEILRNLRFAILFST